jgi:hypothetical protein
MRVLTIATMPITADALRGAVGTDVDDAEVMVVAPALHESPLRFWVSDADEAIARAEDVQSTTVDDLRDAGIPTAGDTGEGDITQAVGDALATFPADRIVLFVHPPDDERYREGIDPHELTQRFGVPADRVEIGSTQP